MSEATVRSIGSAAAEAALAVAWAQWSALVPAAVTSEDNHARSIVDPEALVLLSLAVREHEARLTDLLAGWARSGSVLLSVQRLKTLAREFPESVRRQVPDFARFAADAGDRRWQAHASPPGELHGPTPRDKDLGPLRLDAAPSLMLRLRAGMGVGAKADLLTFLLGLDGAPADLKAISLATAYTGRALRTATAEMTLAGFVDEIPGPPDAYRTQPERWAHVLVAGSARSSTDQRSILPPWRFWSVIFALLVAVIDWEREAQHAGWSSYVASSRARDLLDRYRRPLRSAGLILAPDAAARGAEFLAEFQAAVEQVAEWTRRLA
jgi:hypothetical protein